jgi:hypothetical protein
MDPNKLKNSSVLSSDNIAEIYASFRERVASKEVAVRSVVDAFLQQDPVAFNRVTALEIGDSAFDTALFEAFKRGEIEPDLYHGLMWSLLEASSFSTVEDESGHSFTVTELFALPVTGKISDILELTGSFKSLSQLADTFSSTGYVGEGVQVILSPTTIDPIAAARLRCAVARELAEAFVPYFSHGYTPSDAEDLFEFVQGAFEFLGDPDRDHLAEEGTVTRLVIGATRRTHSNSYPTQADAFIATFIDELSSEGLQASADDFLGHLNERASGSITFNYPMPVTRAAAFSAVASVVTDLNEEAKVLGIRRSNFLMDEISVSRHGDQTAVEGVLDNQVLGPVLVRDELIRRDRLWFINMLSRLCDTVHERKHLLSTAHRLN